MTPIVNMIFPVSPPDYASAAVLPLWSDMLLTIRCPPALPALPSKTKGPALFVGVMGPSWRSISVVVGVRKEASLSSSPMRGWVGVIGRRYSIGPEAGLVSGCSAAAGNGGDIRRAPRRTSRLWEALDALLGSEEFVEDGVRWVSFVITNFLEVLDDSSSSMPSIAKSSCSDIAPLLDWEAITSGLEPAPSSSPQSSSMSSTSASKSVTARQFGHRNCGQDL